MVVVVAVEDDTVMGADADGDTDGDTDGEMDTVVAFVCDAVALEEVAGDEVEDNDNVLEDDSLGVPDAVLEAVREYEAEADGETTRVTERDVDLEAETYGVVLMVRAELRDGMEDTLDDGDCVRDGE